jgi:hypothetical protein
MKSSLKQLVTDVMTINEASLSLVPARKGAYDKAVEVFVAGEIIPTYLSQVKVGQPWHLAEGKKTAEWFVCVSPIKLDYSRDSKNPTFIMGAINVLQAAPIEERFESAPKLGSPVKSVPKLSFCKNDVQDV